MPLQAQVHIENISPLKGNTTFKFPPNHQSISGKAHSMAISKDGETVYIGGNSGVWRSVNGGLNWHGFNYPNPTDSITGIPGSLLSPNIYDLAVSNENPALVFAATGNDVRNPKEDGIYRSQDGALTWENVFQFQNSSGAVGRVGDIDFAVDNPSLLVAAGQFSVGISTDAGDTWTQSFPSTVSSQTISYVEIGPIEGNRRRVYAVGSRIWYSVDGASTWNQDPFNFSLPFPADGLGVSSKAVAIHPSKPEILYVIRNDLNPAPNEPSLAEIWKGDFTNGNGVWTQLPTFSHDFSGTTASGTNFIYPHIAPNGDFYIIASDRRTVHISKGDPVTTNSWKRFDNQNIHVDPRSISVTSDFQHKSTSGSGIGKVFLINDGGIVVSTNGGTDWTLGDQLTTLGLVNVAILPKTNGALPSICIGMGDNNGFFSANGGKNWITQDYRGGDNDCTFSDPNQPSRLLVFAPRHQGGAIFLYSKPNGIPNGAFGTNDRTTVPAPFPKRVIRASGTVSSWIASSPYYNVGYRPLIQTLALKKPKPRGDFITILRKSNSAVLLRTTKLDLIDNPNNWITTATTEASGALVFQEGPDLPDQDMTVVQASGGHENPTYYVSNVDFRDIPSGNGNLWKWQQGMTAWEQIIPAANNPSPNNIRRFFVDPYRKDILYAQDNTNVYKSVDGGDNWIIDIDLRNNLTVNGKYPVDIRNSPNPGKALILDMLFDPYREGYRFAFSPAGVFYTINGEDWKHLVLSEAMPMRVNNGYYDTYTDPCNQALYVSTNNRGLLKISNLPPHSNAGIGQIISSHGKVKLLRVHETGTGYGPAYDNLNTEVIFQLEGINDKSFGFNLKSGENSEVNKGMLNLFREAFKSDKEVIVEYKRTGCQNLEILRAIIKK